MSKDCSDRILACKQAMQAATVPMTSKEWQREFGLSASTWQKRVMNPLLRKAVKRAKHRPHTPKKRTKMLVVVRNMARIRLPTAISRAANFNANTTLYMQLIDNKIIIERLR